MPRDSIPPVIRVPAGAGPGRAVVSQPVFRHLVGCGSPRGRPWVYLVNFLVANLLCLPNCIQKYFTNAILHFVQGFFIPPKIMGYESRVMADSTHFAWAFFRPTLTCHQIHLTLHQPLHALDPRSGCLLIYSVFVSSQILRRGRWREAPHLDYILSVHSDSEPANIICFRKA